MLANILLTFTSLIISSDSIRTEVIDGKTYIIHRVEQKETLFGISRKYGVALLAIVESNPNASSGLEIGQLIKVPYTPNNRTKTAEGTVHRVGAKETLYSISKQYGVSVAEIKEWNNLSDNGLKLGQELMIKEKKEEVPAKASSLTHTVEQGETMYAISKKYGITIQQIKDWNYLTSNELKPGQVIFVKERQGVVTAGNPTSTGSPTQTTSTTSSQTVSSTTSNNSNSNPTATIPIQPVTSVIGNDEIHETGMVMMLDGTEGNRKYFAQHRTAKIGTILHVKNNTNHREVFVRVVGKLGPTAPSDVVLQISQSAYEKLDGGSNKYPVEVIYFK